MASLLRRFGQWVVELASELAFAMVACAGLAALVGAARWGWERHRVSTVIFLIGVTGVLSSGVWVSVRGTPPKGRVSAMVASVAGGLAAMSASGVIGVQMSPRYCFGLRPTPTPLLTKRSV